MPNHRPSWTLLAVEEERELKTKWTFPIIFICNKEPCAIFFLLQMCVSVKSHKILIKTTQVCSFNPLKCFLVFYNTCTIRLPLPILQVSEKICDRFIMFQLVSLSLFTSTEISHSEFQLQWLRHDIPTGPGPRGLSVLAATWCTDSSSVRWQLLLQSTFTLTFPSKQAQLQFTEKHPPYSPAANGNKSTDAMNSFG